MRLNFFTISSRVLIGLAVFGASSCSSLFYQPSKNSFFLLDPSLVISEEVSIKTFDGETLRGWYFPAQTETTKNKKGALTHSRGLIVQFHGNGENLTSHFLSYAWVMNEGFDFLAFDYRGYGQSTGKPSQAGLYRDALAALDWATSKSSHVIAIGQSLGGAVLARSFPDFKKRAQVDGIVLESTFYSYQAISVNLLRRGWLTWPFQWLGAIWISDEYSPEDFYPEISPTPLLVIHGTKDALIPFSFGEKIFALAKEPKEFIKVENGAHIDAMNENRHGTKYREKLMQWINKLPSFKNDE